MNTQHCKHCFLSCPTSHLSGSTLMRLWNSLCCHLYSRFFSFLRACLKLSLSSSLLDVSVFHSGHQGGCSMKRASNEHEIEHDIKKFASDSVCILCVKILPFFFLHYCIKISCCIWYVKALRMIVMNIPSFQTLP